MTIEEKLGRLGASLAGATPEEKKFHAMFRDHQENVREVPVIVIAMNRAQAQELWQGTLAPETLSERFAAMRQALIAAFPDEAAWLEHYGGTPETWKPHIFQTPDPVCIRDLLEDFAIKQCIRPRNTCVWPDVKESQAQIWDRDDEEQSDFWAALPNYYLLVIDGVSLFHPEVRRRLHAVRRVEKRVAVLMLSSIKPERCALDQCIEEELNAEDSIKWLFREYATSLDALYEIGLNHDRHFYRWLRAGLPELLRPRPAGEFPYPSPGSGSAIIYNQGTPSS